MNIHECSAVQCSESPAIIGSVRNSNRRSKLAEGKLKRHNGSKSKVIGRNSFSYLEYALPQFKLDRPISSSFITTNERHTLGYIMIWFCCVWLFLSFQYCDINSTTIETFTNQRRVVERNVEVWIE